MADESKPKAETVRVKNIGTSVVDLDDGRSLAPGEYAEEVNIGDPHNDRLVLAGIICEVPAERHASKSTDAKKEA